jgi:hypothetical protein
MKNRKKTIILVGFLAIFSCTDKFSTEMKTSIEKQCNESYEECEFSFDNVFSFDWDSLYIFDSMLYPEEISKELGVKCNCDMLKDGNYLVVFKRGKNIVEKYTSRCQDITFLNKNNNGVVQISKMEKLRIKRKNLNNEYHYYFSN